MQIQIAEFKLHIVDKNNFIVSQIFTTQCNPSYLICHDISHKECNCKEIYGEVLSSEDGTLAKYLAKKIFEFIEQ